MASASYLTPEYCQFPSYRALCVCYCWWLGALLRIEFRKIFHLIANLVFGEARRTVAVLERIPEKMGLPSASQCRVLPSGELTPLAGLTVWYAPQTIAREIRR